VNSLTNAQGLQSVILNPAHRTVRLSSATASWNADVVLLPSGKGYLINPSMPVIGSAQTFQLWALSSGKVVSLGVLGSRPDGAAVRVERTMTVLMITAEPLGGTPTPTTPVLVRGNLPVGL
jgi:anti-sigma-K factor RskA